VPERGGGAIHGGGQEIAVIIIRYIAQELVTAHQGRIDLRSVPGEGTMLTVHL
jgi:hypothetical protein